jgi:hypothetical protein
MLIQGILTKKPVDRFSKMTQPHLPRHTHGAKPSSAGGPAPERYCKDGNPLPRFKCERWGSGGGGFANR